MYVYLGRNGNKAICQLFIQNCNYFTANHSENFHRNQVVSSIFSDGKFYNALPNQLWLNVITNCSYSPPFNFVVESNDYSFNFILNTLRKSRKTITFFQNVRLNSFETQLKIALLHKRKQSRQGVFPIHHKGRVLFEIQKNKDVQNFTERYF